MSQTRPAPPAARLAEDAAPPDVSVVVTVFDEERSVEELYRRTVAALEGLGRPYELIFVDDGSRDGTFARIERLHADDGRVRAVRFKRNFGQHPAMHAGLARGEGRSRYSPLRLTRLALHVLAGFWPQPIQWIGIALGVVCTLLALALGGYGIGYWIDHSNFPGPLFGGVAVLFVLGVQGFILALVGEYLGRIQRDVSGRPLYTVEREL